jgi:hypothetical protein
MRFEKRCIRQKGVYLAYKWRISQVTVQEFSGSGFQRLQVRSFAPIGVLEFWNIGFTNARVPGKSIGGIFRVLIAECYNRE